MHLLMRLHIINNTKKISKSKSIKTSTAQKVYLDQRDETASVFLGTGIINYYL